MLSYCCLMIAEPNLLILLKTLLSASIFKSKGTASYWIHFFIHQKDATPFFPIVILKPQLTVLILSTCIKKVDLNNQKKDVKL